MATARVADAMSGISLPLTTPMVAGKDSNCSATSEETPVRQLILTPLTLHKSDRQTTRGETLAE